MLAMSSFLLYYLSFYWLVALVSCAPSQVSRLAEPTVQQRAKDERSRRSVQFVSTFHSSECSQRKETPRNCYHAKQLGHSISGVYEIDPRDGLGSFNVSCDMQTDGGGWTIFQRRKDGSEDFFRGWEDYKNGFGELYGEYWLGLDKIHRLTATPVTLRVDLTATDNSKEYAEYEDFTIGSEASMYVMYFGKYTGTAGDSLAYHKGKRFSTKDNGSGCASIHKGAWWYSGCYHSNLNGLYKYGSSDVTTANWKAFKSYESLQTTEMKLK